VIPIENAQVVGPDLALAEAVPALEVLVEGIIGVIGAAAADLLSATKYSKTSHQQHINLLNEFFLMEQPS